MTEHKDKYPPHPTAAASRLSEPAAQSRMGRILEASFNEVYLFDATTLRFAAASPGALQNLGYTLEELRQITPLDIKPLSEVEFEALIEPLRTGRQRIVVFETTHRRKNGSFYPAEVRLQLSLDEEPPLFLAIIQDITDRREAARLLACQTDILRRQSELLDLAPALIRDLSDHIIYWNRGVERLYGWSETEALGRGAHDLLDTRFPQPLPDIMQELRRDGHWEGELTHTRRDGSRLTVVSYWALHRDDTGAPSAVLEVNNDITNLKQAQEQIRELNTGLEQRVRERTAQLEQVNQELEAFSYSVSHDLRGPLRGIDGFSQALMEDYGHILNDEARHYLTRMRQAAERMGQLIDDLLKLARITRAEMHSEQVDLVQLFHSIAQELQTQDPAHAADFVAPNELLVQGDGALLRIVMENLLSNAWKFSARQPTSRVELGQTRQGTEAVYFVRDNGVGFNMAYADKLFGAFQRLHRTSEFDGTGIGLVTVSRIVQRHGGRVWGKSVVGQGATFYFTLHAPADAFPARASL